MLLEIELTVFLFLFLFLLLLLFFHISSVSPKKNALFLVDLMLDKEGCHFSTNLNNFEPALIGLFDKGIASTQHVPQLEKVGSEEQGQKHCI